MSSLLGSFLVVWRESFEAILVVYLLWLNLTKAQLWKRSFPYVMAGVVIGLLSSLLVAYLMTQTELLGSQNSEILAAALPIVAAMMMLHMVLWMAKHGKEVGSKIKDLTRQPSDFGLSWGVLFLVAFAISREGFETVLFLSGLNSNSEHFFLSKEIQIALALALGLLAAFATIYAIFKGLQFFSMKWFFKISNAFLLVLAGGLLAGGVNQLINLELLHPLQSQVWDSSAILSSDSKLGEVLAMLAGYTPTPSLTLVLAYFGFWFIAVLGYRFIEAKDQA